MTQITKLWIKIILNLLVLLAYLGFGIFMIWFILVTLGHIYGGGQ